MKNITSLLLRLWKKGLILTLSLWILASSISTTSASSKNLYSQQQDIVFFPPPQFPHTPSDPYVHYAIKDNPIHSFKITNLPESNEDLFLPLILTASPFLNITNRQVVQNYYDDVYLSNQEIPHGWNGDVSICDPGSTNEAFKNAIAQRINYFRAMAGVPANIHLDSIYNQKAQAAALMMSANGTLSHSPPSSWKCYTTDGAEAAGSSNLAMGMYGPNAISGYMSDSGSNNTAVGHRRWILYPQTQKMGSGDVITGWGWNALWVFDRDNMWGNRPLTRDEFVAWPPPGFVPSQVVFQRWSFSYANANFNASIVSMNCDGSIVSLTVYPVQNGYGENTIVWEPSYNFSSETTCTIIINDVSTNGTPRDFEYEVTIFDASIP